jgi:pimeloyl-ACP methyl ester carboxylesterase
MARDYDIHFTPDWHRPIGVILDAVERGLPEVATSRKVLVGISLGGLLAARAAAFEPRLDGVVIFGAPFDALETALSMNPLLRLLYNAGRRGVLNRLVGLVMRLDEGVGWAIRNGMYTFGAATPYDMLRASARYTLHDVHTRVTCDVLALRGVDDIYGPDQGSLFRDAFPNARSYDLVEYDRATNTARLDPLSRPRKRS